MKDYFERERALDKCCWKLTKVIFDSKRKRGDGLYKEWILAGENERMKVRKEMKKVIREEMLEKGLFKAIAKDVMREGEIDIKSEVYRWLRNEMFDRDDVKCMKWLKGEIEG